MTTIRTKIGRATLQRLLRRGRHVFKIIGKAPHSLTRTTKKRTFTQTRATTPGFHSTRTSRRSSRGKTSPPRTTSNKNSKPRYAATGKSANASSGLNVLLRMESTSSCRRVIYPQITEPRSARTSTTTSIAHTETDASSTTTKSQSTCDHCARAAT